MSTKRRQFRSPGAATQLPPERGWLTWPCGLQRCWRDWLTSASLRRFQQALDWVTTERLIHPEALPPARRAAGPYALPVLPGQGDRQRIAPAPDRAQAAAGGTCGAARGDRI